MVRSRTRAGAACECATCPQPQSAAARARAKTGVRVVELSVLGLGVRSVCMAPVDPLIDGRCKAASALPRFRRRATKRHRANAGARSDELLVQRPLHPPPRRTGAPSWTTSQTLTLLLA